MRTLALAAAAALVFAPPPEFGDEVRSFSTDFDAAGMSELDLTFPIGELNVEGTSSNRISVEVRVECSSRRSLDTCLDRAEDVKLGARERADSLELWIDGYSKWRSRGMHLEMTVRMPRNLDVTIDMSIGELEIEDLYGNVTVDMSIGEVSLRSSEEMVGRVTLDTGIGETSLQTSRGRNSSAGLFTREVDWTEGNGDSAIRIELGIGEVDVRLR